MRYPGAVTSLSTRIVCRPTHVHIIIYVLISSSVYSAWSIWILSVTYTPSIITLALGARTCPFSSSISCRLGEVSADVVSSLCDLIITLYLWYVDISCIWLACLPLSVINDYHSLYSIHPFTVFEPCPVLHSQKHCFLPLSAPVFRLFSDICTRLYPFELLVTLLGGTAQSNSDPHTLAPNQIMAKF